MEPLPDRLRVALLVAEAGWGGGEQQARELIHGLEARGHQCLVITRADSAFHEQIAFGRKRETVAFARSGRTPAAILRIRRSLMRFQPHVLHLNDSSATTLGAMAAYGLPIPVRVSARKVAFPVKSPLKYRLAADRIICVSECVRRRCEHDGLPPEMLEVVYDGVDPNRIMAGERERGRGLMGVAPDQPVLLCIANLNPGKGHTFLLQAMPRILKRHPRALLALCGAGPTEWKLMRQAVRRGIDESILWLGHRHDIPDLIQAADVFAMPSLNEGLCSTLIDAMFAGVPIVSTSAGGIPELLQRSDDTEPHAIMVEPANSGALAGAIIEQLESRRKARLMAERAREFALERFTADAMIEGTLAVYRSVPNEQLQRAA